MIKIILASLLVTAFGFSALALSGPLSAYPSQVMLPTAELGQNPTQATLRLVNDGGPIMGLRVSSTCGNSINVYAACPGEMDPLDSCTVTLTLNTVNSGIFTCQLLAEGQAMPPLTVSIWGHVE